MTVLVPELVLDERGVRRGVAVAIEEGRIAAVPPARAAPAEARRLEGVALCPGFVSAHSHAFQRELRGRAERPGASDFWRWRDAMYELAAALEPETMRAAAERCFRQLRGAGFTAVGEFHYVHHRPDGTPYAPPNALAEAVCEAAEAAGIRIVLLLAAYERGGASLPATGAQRRFCDVSVEAFLERVEALRAWAERRPLVDVGVAPHSVRAVSRGWLERLAAYSDERGLPLHVHAGEQPREVAECLEEHGLRPVELLAETGALGPRTTVVHATHVSAREVELLAAARATVCVCPTTEGNLGDGWPPARELAASGVPLAIGTDANLRLDPLEELRELETCARRQALARGVLGLGAVLAAGWSAGARALGLAPAGVAPGAPADLVALDLRHPTLAGVADEDLAAALVFSGDASLVHATWVAGERR